MSDVHGEDGQEWHAHFTPHGDPHVVTDPRRPWSTHVATVDTSPDDYGRANTLLIAAAPDLLRLLAALVEADADAEVVPDVYANHVRQRWEEARDEARRLLSQFGRTGAVE